LFLLSFNFDHVITKKTIHQFSNTLHHFAFPLLTEQPQPDTIFFILRALSFISKPVLMQK